MTFVFAVLFSTSRSSVGRDVRRFYEIPRRANVTASRTRSRFSWARDVVVDARSRRTRYFDDACKMSPDVVRPGDEYSNFGDARDRRPRGRCTFVTLSDRIRKDWRWLFPDRIIKYVYAKLFGWHRIYRSPHVTCPTRARRAGRIVSFVYFLSNNHIARRKTLRRTFDRNK